MSEASRADAALTALFGGPCACPQWHASSPEGTCGIRAADTLRRGGTVLAVCIPCARCLSAVDFAVPPGRASGSASRYQRTG